MKTILFLFVFAIPFLSYSQDPTSDNSNESNICQIAVSNDTICYGDSTVLKINFLTPDSSDILIQKIENDNYLTSGTGSWEIKDTCITNYSNTYGLPGMLVYGDSSQSYGLIEAEVRQTSSAALANIGIAMGVTQNEYNDEHPYNGPGSYFLAISDEKIYLYGGVSNTPMGYAGFIDDIIASADIQGLSVSDWNTIKLEITANEHINGYVNDVLYIDYDMPDGKVFAGYFALVTSNSYNEYRSISSYYFPVSIRWSTGDTISPIIVYPKEDQDYHIEVEGLAHTWKDTATVTVNDLPSIFLGNDTIISEVITLDAGADFSSYSWNTGDTAQLFTMDNSWGDGEYLFSVEVIDENGCRNSDSINITIDNSTIIPTHIGAADIIIYPNPTNGILTFIFESEIQREIVIRDLTGRIQKNIRSFDRSFELDITNFKSGVYIIILREKDSRSIRRVLKI